MRIYRILLLFIACLVSGYSFAGIGGGAGHHSHHSHTNAWHDNSGYHSETDSHSSSVSSSFHLGVSSHELTSFASGLANRLASRVPSQANSQMTNHTSEPSLSYIKKTFLAPQWLTARDSKHFCEKICYRHHSFWTRLWHPGTSATHAACLCKQKAI